MLDLTRDYDSYLFGLILTDGSLYFNTRNRGKVIIELALRDQDIMSKIKKNFYYKSYLYSRKRDTNFKEQNEFVGWACYQKDFRDELLLLGIPSVDKSINAIPPITEYNKSAFWRGVIDGDGSIGMTGTNNPFISLTIVSEMLAQEYFTLLKEQFGIIKVNNRNSRDNIYNVVVKNEDAIALGDYIYKDSTIHIDRKYNNYLEFKNWKRTKPRVIARSWTKEEDLFILTHNIFNSMINLGRTEKSIRMRLWRLRGMGKN